MTTIELQQLLAVKIFEINDLSLLSKIKSLVFSYEKSKTIYEISSIEKQHIFRSEQDYKNDNTLTNEEVFNEIDQWLKQK